MSKFCYARPAFGTFLCVSGPSGAFEPARTRWGARHGRSSPLAARAHFGTAWPPRNNRCGAQIETISSQLGCAGALEVAAQACSASLERSSRLLEPARLRCFKELCENNIQKHFLGGGENPPTPKETELGAGTLGPPTTKLGTATAHMRAGSCRAVRNVGVSNGGK